MKQESLLGNDFESHTPGPVECLGMTFENDEARRAHFTALLKEKLKDPEFRAIEGFPIGTDEAILELSDPPYYTACPNPWLSDFVELWESQKTDIEDNYHREPFAADVSEGKSDPIYNAHTYHTKVPHKAIMRFILHYTNPGDVVMDGFCGTGMTGVAAKLCGNKEVVSSLGYHIDSKGIIHERRLNELGDEELVAFSKLGERNVVLNDLSPVASFISHNYNKVTDVYSFERKANAILEELYSKYSWLYETKHFDGKVGKINYTVWSDVFLCGSCSNEVVFHDVAVDGNKVKTEFECPHCNTLLTKRSLERAFETRFDSDLNSVVKQIKQVPVLINYNVGKQKFDKKPDEDDFKVIDSVNELEVSGWYPSERMIPGKETRRNDSVGLTHVHHYYSKKTLLLLSEIRSKCKDLELLLWFNSQLINLSKLNRYRPGVSFPYNPLSGTMYVGSQVSEANVFDAYRNKLKKLRTAFKNINKPAAVTTQSLSNLEGFQVDYIFIDPPFGANLNYSELSSLWESWLGVKTNNIQEAIENSAQNKTLDDYRKLMLSCFKSAYKVLKPGGWATIEFSNTKASVWNSIQSALSDAGFIVANVSALDKQLLSFKAVNTPTAVKQDLIISAYKPTDDFVNKFSSQEGEQSIWDFVEYHLGKLPIVRTAGDSLISSSERDVRVIYDRAIGYFFRNNRDIPLDSGVFQKEISSSSRFTERDGMYFLPEQAVTYDKIRRKKSEVQQLDLFVNDEVSAIAWLRDKLIKKPMTYSDIHPLFINELSGWKKSEFQLELLQLLEENFLKYEGGEDVPSQIHSYLSSNFKELRNLNKNDIELVNKAKDRWYVPDVDKVSDIEKLRHKSLLKEFRKYIDCKTKVKTPRSEALRVGFAELWNSGKFKLILDVAHKIPKDLLQEDEKLIMFYDNALTVTQENDEW
ncbi:DNA methyltransferase [Vibrio cholerae]|uniref:DNA methyltransferase n=1 Tax=Vibrio cholerae TaxID=666 RepID=UPI0031F5566F